MSYKYRFILAFLSLELFFIFLIISVNFFTIESNSQKYIDERIQSTKLLITKLIQSPMSVYDLATLDDIVKNIKKIENIKYIIIEDKQRRVLSKNIPNDKLQLINKLDNLEKVDLDGKKLVAIHEEIYFDKILLGYLHLVFDTTNNFKSIEENKSITFLIILLQILISTALAYFIGRRLTNSLLNLSATAEVIGKGNSTSIPYLNTKSEIGYLARSLQNMQKEIINRSSELKIFFKLFENSLESIVITDDKGIIENVNLAFEKITAYKKSEVFR